MTGRRRLGVVVATVAALLVPLTLAPAAAAHALLQTAAPRFGAVLPATPRQVTLTYSEDVVGRLAQVEVLAPGGRDVAGRLHLSGGSVVSVPLTPGPRGSYTVRWRMVAADDGHVTEGAFSFGVRTKPVAPVPAAGSGIPVAPELLAWLQFAGIVLAGGALAFRALVTAPAARGLGVTAADAPAAIGVAIVGAVLALHGALFGFLTGAYAIVGSGAANFVNTQIIPIRVSTHSGQAFTFSSFAWLIVLVALVGAWVYPRVREWLLGAAGALSLAIAFGLSWASHPAARGTLVLAVDYLHLLAGALWVGGLVALAILAGTARSRSRADRDALFRACLLRFSQLAAPLVFVLAAAGTYLAIRELPSVSAIVSSRYGVLLLAKTSVFACAIGLAGYHRRSVVPRVAAGAPAASVRQTLSIEAGLLLGLLVLAAILTQTAPPA